MSTPDTNHETNVWAMCEAAAGALARAWCGPARTLEMEDELRRLADQLGAAWADPEPLPPSLRRIAGLFCVVLGFLAEVGQEYRAGDGDAAAAAVDVAAWWNRRLIAVLDREVLGWP